MVFSGNRVVAQVDIKCNGDAFLGILRNMPNNLKQIAPNHMLGCDLREGEWGAVGCIVHWNYKIDGKSICTKTILEAADEINKSITYAVLEGDALMQIYKSFKSIIQVSENAENNLVTWTTEYENINEAVPDPDSLIDLHSKLIKAIETYLLQ